MPDYQIAVSKIIRHYLPVGLDPDYLADAHEATLCYAISNWRREIKNLRAYLHTKVHEIEVAHIKATS